MYGNEIWKRLTCFVLAFGTGVLIAEIFFVDEILSRPTEQVNEQPKIEFHPPKQTSKQPKVEFHLPVMLDCKREYVVIPLAQRNLRSETIDQPSDWKKRKKDQILTNRNGPKEIDPRFGEGTR